MSGQSEFLLFVVLAVCSARLLLLVSGPLAEEDEEVPAAAGLR